MKSDTNGAISYPEPSNSSDQLPPEGPKRLWVRDWLFHGDIFVFHRFVVLPTLPSCRTIFSISTISPATSFHCWVSSLRTLDLPAKINTKRLQSILGRFSEIFGRSSDHLRLTPKISEDYRETSEDSPTIFGNLLKCLKIMKIIWELKGLRVISTIRVLTRFICNKHSSLTAEDVFSLLNGHFLVHM